jgi:hypothetical protein
MAAMTLTLLPGYPDRIGKRFAWVGYANGPSSYTTAGNAIALPGFQNYIDIITSSGILTVTGTYYVRAIPSGGGKRPTWKLKWYSATTPFAEVTSATDLSAEVIQLAGFGGVY